MPLNTDIWVVRDMEIAVELHPTFGGDDAVERQYKEVVRQIKRHIDDVSYVGITKHYVCRWCGSERSGAIDTDDTPLCCDPAVEAHATA